MAGKLPGRALDSNTSITVSNISFGSNLSINTTAISIGNSTVNTVLRSNSASFSGHLMPTANITYDIGNSSMRWRDLWLSGTTINLGGAVIQTDTDTGAVAIIPKPTNDTPNPMAVILSAMGGVTAAQSVNGVLGAPAIAAAARSNNAMAVPIDIATSSPSNGQMLVWSTSSNTFIPHSTVTSLTVTGTSTLKAISSNGSVGSAGQLLASNGTSTYWTNPPASTNTDAQYTWANTHTFNAPITIANTLSVGNNVTITGNLIVTGTRVFANTTTVDLGDNIITLNADIGSAAPSENAGFEIHRGSSSNVSLLWNETTDKWTLTTDGSTFLNIATNNDVSTAYSNAIAYSGNAAAAYTNATSFASNADNLSSGTVAFARLPAVYVGTTQIQSTSAAQALSGITTLAAGNTNITGFINVSTNTATFGTAAYVVANGNVGIGTASPAQLLDVNGNAIIRGIQGFNATNETATLFIGDSASYIQAVYDGGLDFYQNSTFRMRIQGGTGRVGIANNAPANMLRVEGDASIATTLAAGNTTITGTVNVSDTVTIRGFTGGTLTSAVSGYAKTLVIGGIYNQPYNTANAVLVHIADYSNDTGDNVYPIYVEDENNFVDFFLYAGNNTAGTDKRAYFGGSVGIGNTTPTAKLQVDGTIKDSIGNVRTIQRTGTAKTTSYTLATSDVGQFVEVGTGGSIVVPNDTFATGDVISIFNNTSGSITLTMNITNAYIGGVDADKNSITLLTRGIATILFLSGTLCIVNGNVS